MKKRFFACALLLVTMNVFCQSDKDIREKEVPGKVKQYINDHYPEAENKKYYKETEHDTSFYEISFRYKGDRYDLRFLMNGDLYEVERFLRFEELPVNMQNKIRADLDKRYSSYKIKTTEEVNPGQDMVYEVTVRGKKGNHSGYYELFYDADGNFISEEEELLRSIPYNSGF